MINFEYIQSLSVSSINKLCEKYNSTDIKKFYKNPEFLQLLGIMQRDKRKGVFNLYKKLNTLKESFENELIRVKKLYDFDKSFNVRYIAGVDEVGRGPLAGPIVAAAVVLDLYHIIEYIDDSKKIKEGKREELSDIIKKLAIDYNIVQLSNEEIDKRGIGFCNNDVFIRAVEGLKIKPDLILSDGYLIKNWNKVKNIHVVKGDTKSASIACSSILAKVFRDNLMKEYHHKYPNYNFKKNVGYGTKEHIEAIKEYGICEIHRNSFLTKL